MKHPKDINWKFGFVPDIKEGRKIFIFTHNYCGLIVPWGNELNPVKWCDDSLHPRWGFENPYGYWFYLEEMYP